MTDKEKIKELKRNLSVVQSLFSKAQEKIRKYEEFFKFIKEQVEEEK